MICYLIRHGQDNETVRGGWSQEPLTPNGIEQVKKLAEYCEKENLKIQHIYSSDLQRAKQTADAIADALNLPIIQLPQFREVNNGCLAGMENTIALERYPGLFWNQLGWEQCYPDGESPKQFYERIQAAWETFSEEIAFQNENVVLVTHGGVIHVIRTLLENRPYTNQEKHKKVDYAEIIVLSNEDGKWKEVVQG